MTRVRILLIFLTVLLGSVTTSGWAQQLAPLGVASPILTIDSEQLFETSEYGKQTIKEFEARATELASENRKIEEELIEEERALTELRPTISAQEFRVLADAFDAKVQQTRAAQDGKSRALNSELDDRRVVFLNAAVPVLEQLMREAGAAVVLERRSVFIGSNAVDITRAAVERLDIALANDELTPEQ